MATKPARSIRAAENARKRREKMRALGMREIRVWVPDTRTPTFKEEARRQMLAVAASRHAKADQDFIDAISDPFDS